jgi:hypothetical protein
VTLRIVSDNVTELPIGNVQDIPEMLRLLADDIEEGQWGDVATLIGVMVGPEGVAHVTYGEAGSIYDLMGIFETAKMQVFADHANDDD